MSRHMDFIGQRADKAIVVDVHSAEDMDGGGIVKNGVVKEVEEYTIGCDECDGVGYYDQRGEIICDGCGMVLSGEKSAVIKTEFSEGEKDSIGRGRGLETPPTPVPGTHQPSLSYEDYL